MSKFHAGYQWYFERGSEGSVRVTHDGSILGAAVTFVVPAETWDRLVSSLAVREERPSVARVEERVEEPVVVPPDDDDDGPAARAARRGHQRKKE